MEVGLQFRTARMRKLSLLAVTAGLIVPLMAKPGDQGPALETTNVNSRYTVERVSLSGWKSRVSNSLRADLDRVVGEKLDHPYLEQLASRIKKELRVSDVAVKVARGTSPDRVIVTFEIIKGREQNFDLNVAKFLYRSNEGWTGEGVATTRVAGNTFTFGVVSDGDELVERYTGFRTKFERQKLGTDRLGVSFEFDSFHQQWNPATVAAQPSSQLELYDSRQVYSPQATLIIAQPLELRLGVRFSRFRLSTPASRTESSNGVVSTLRYHPRWGSADDPQHPDEPEHELDASYSLDAATRVLESDPVYTRHSVRARYKFHHIHNLIEIGFLAGRITGLAPLFDRFVLGNSSTLRGWSKYDLDPVGGSRVIHGSIDYKYRFVQVFYDAGAIWDRPQDREAKQSVGVGLKKDNFQLAVAFPLGGGHSEPVFFVGMNF
jgi:hypothetical protein